MPKRGYHQSPEHIARRQGFIAATSPEGILRETERLLAERRAGRPVRRRAYNLLVATGGIDLTESEAGQIGRMMIALMRPNDDDNPYAGIPSMTERAARTRRMANKLQGEPPGDDATPHIAHGPVPDDDDRDDR